MEGVGMTARHIRSSGLGAMVDGRLAVALSGPFAAVYFRTYAGFDPPQLS